MEPQHSTIPNNGGLFKTGQVFQLGVQALTAVTIIGWTLVTSLIILMVRYISQYITIIVITKNKNLSRHVRYSVHVLAYFKVAASLNTKLTKNAFAP